MKVTALEEYGLRCMVELARRWDDDRAVTISEIAEAEGISDANAGKLLLILRKTGLVEAERGRNGGYRLTRSPEYIQLSEILEALGEPVYSQDHCSRFASDDNGSCVHAEDCVIRVVWQDLRYLVGSVLEGVSLHTLAAGKYQRLKPGVTKKRSDELRKNKSLINHLEL